MITKEKIMTTQEIANRLVELCRTGEFEQVQRELYAENAESIEPESAAEQGWEIHTKGLDNILKKGEQWQNMTEQVHSLKFSDPLLAGDFFACSSAMDVTMKGQPRSTFEEICVYHVKDGKIVSEQFFG